MTAYSCEIITKNTIKTTQIKMIRNTLRKRKAFSLIELSIVIVLIGVLTLGVIGSKHLLKKAKINTAQAITRSSPISGIPNNKLWLESSLAEISLGEELSTGDLLPGWKDASTSKASTVISVAGTGPAYSNSINDIQAVKFDENSEANHLTLDNAYILNGTNYTIFIVDKKLDTNIGVKNYLLGEEDSFGIGYETNSSIIQTHGESASANNQVFIEDSTANNPRVISLTHSSVDGNQIYIGATLVNEDTTAEAKTHLSEMDTLAIGKGYNGEIGEIVIFDRDLKRVERQEIEDYLSDKWSVPNTRNTIASCAKGIVIGTACDLSNARCDTPSYITGVDRLPIDVASGPGSITCDNEDYADSVDYTCTNGVYASTDSCTEAAKCISVTIAGIDDTGTIAHLDDDYSTCNSDGYDSSITLEYSCNNGDLNITSTATSCTCADHFAGSTCNACEAEYADISGNPDCTTCADGYVDDGSGGCRIGASCTTGLSTISGSSDSIVAGLAHGTTSNITCNNDNFDGSTRTYTCDDGTLSGSGACETCASGYYYDSDTSACIIPPIICEGGTKTCLDGGTEEYCPGSTVLHVFTADGTLTCSATGTSITGVQYLGVGAGGKGGTGSYVVNYPYYYKRPGGGGGGGQVVSVTGKSFVAGDSLTILVSNKNAATTMSGTFGGVGIGTLTFAKGGNGGNALQHGSAGGDAGGGGAGASSRNGGSGTPAGSNSSGTTNSEHAGWITVNSQGGNGGGYSTHGAGTSSSITGTSLAYGTGGSRGISWYDEVESTTGKPAGCGGNGGHASSADTVDPSDNCSGTVIFSYSY